MQSTPTTDLPPLPPEWQPGDAAGGVRVTHTHSPQTSYLTEHTHRLPIGRLGAPHVHPTHREAVVDRMTAGGIVTGTEFTAELRNDRTVRFAVTNPAFIAHIVADVLENLRHEGKVAYVDDLPEGDVDALADWIGENAEYLDTVPVTPALPAQVAMTVRQMLGGGEA